MIAYLDTSALFRLYVAEKGSDELADLITTADAVATSAITRAEIPAALAKARRMHWLTPAASSETYKTFLRDWADMTQIPATAALLNRAGELAWKSGLRGYDAVHLASALAYQDLTGAAVVLMTFDRQFSEAARDAGLAVWPDESINPESHPVKKRS